MAGKGKDDERDEELEEEVEDEEVDDDDDDEGDDGAKEDEKNKSKQSGGSAGAKSKGGKTFSQKQVSKMMANEKRQGKSSVYNALGIDPDDKETIAAVKALVAERGASKSANTGDGADDSELTEMQERAILAEAKVDAMTLGCSPKYVDDVVTLALAKCADSGSDLKTVLGELKTKYADWFDGDSADDDDNEKNKSKKNGAGTGSSMKRSQKRAKDGEEEQSLGARLAAQRVSKKGDKKKSYWS